MRQLTVVVKRDHIVRLRVRSLHAWRTHRHPWHCNPFDRRTIREEPQDVLCRHVPLDYVSVNDRCVAGTHPARYTYLLLDTVDIRYVCGFHHKTISSRCVTHIEQQPHVGDL